MDRRIFLCARRAGGPQARAAAALLCVTAALMTSPRPAAAQFERTPVPVPVTDVSGSEADSDRAYRPDGARHLYARYAPHIFKGKLPPLMYAVAITETEIDENGEVVDAVMLREPAAAKEVAPWVLKLIRQAGPFPKPAKMGRVKYLDIWLVDKSGRFQLDTLTEGQR